MKRISVYLRKDQLEFLNYSEGTKSEQIRYAIDEYIKRKRKISKSPSKGGDTYGSNS